MHLSIAKVNILIGRMWLEKINCFVCLYDFSYFTQLT